MSDRTPNSFPTENGWTVGNMNFGHFPPYQNEVPNFPNSTVTPQVPFALNNFSSDPLKRIPDHGKYASGYCPPYANDVNPYEPVNDLKLSSSTNNHVQTVSHHPMHHVSNQANFTPCVGNNVKNFAPPQSVYFNSGGSGLPTEHHPNTFHNLREVAPFHQNFSGFPPATGTQMPPFVQRQVFDVPPPIVRCASSADCAPPVANFQTFPMQPFAVAEPLPFPNFPVAPPPAYVPPPVQPVAEKGISEKERLLAAFLGRHRVTQKKTTERNVTVAEFRSALKMALSLRNELLSCKEKLSCLLHADGDEWNTEINRLKELKKQLSSVCSVLSSPENLSAVKKRLRTATKKRAVKSRLKQESSLCKLQKVCEREALHQEIDKWLDGIQEKNLKLKREAEMKKEADNILSEVRRKIHEVKKASEKLNVFEKLRATRQANAEQKGLFVSSEHGARFCERMSSLRGTLASQLQDYESEEHALRVMLEAEQEGQLEEEALWRLHKTKALQRKKQQVIKEGLFGHTEEPIPGDDLFLFYQHQNAGNCSIDALVQIRHHWDVHLAENGDTVPQQWVVPFPPSSATWEMSLEV